MGDGVVHDVHDVLISKRVGHLFAAAFRPHEPVVSKHPEVLTDQGLAHPKRINQLVDAARPRSQLVHHGKPNGRGQRPQQHAGAAEPLLRRQTRGNHQITLTGMHVLFHPEPISLGESFGRAHA
jgi:hypothetical protein